MKIKKIKWQNHPILKNLELNFVNNATGLPYDTIILAGENGTGKTAILQTLSNFLNRDTFEPFEYIEYIADGKSLTAKKCTQTYKSFYDLFEGDRKTEIRCDANNNPQKIEENTLDIRHYGCVFSKARADFKTNDIKSTSTLELDKSKYDNDISDDFTSLKQLIVDVESKDCAEYTQKNRSLEIAIPWKEFEITSKMYRFKKAFNNFFEKIKFEKIDDINNKKVILFTKGSDTIDIDHLSTGEKQIVFRGTYLLKNSSNLNGSTVMIDEPELSMHPKWQSKVLDYYKNLFIEHGNQKVQLLIATHSDYVIESALKNDGKNIVICLKEDSGTITSKKIDSPAFLPSITSAETNYMAFDIVSNDYHIELYGHIQNRHNKLKVKECDEYIKNHANYNASIHKKLYTHNTTQYETLPTYIRNAIDHPDPTHSFTQEELRASIELLITLC